MMQRIGQILEQELYQEYLNRNEKAELQRKFCHHDMGHFLDVARIAAILNLEEKYEISKEMIYAAALLHDIGRWKQYEDGSPHEMVSARLAPEILVKSGFNNGEIDMIVTAISQHRNADIRNDKDLSGLLYRADKLSRACFACKAEKDCDWKAEKKNRWLEI